MTTTETGRRAELAACEYLVSVGYQVLEQNYRKPHCEIDIVVQLDETIYFVEVKYRSSEQYGGGLDYITPAKLQHMQRAAATWVRDRRWHGGYELSAVAVGGKDFEVLEHIESIF